MQLVQFTGQDKETILSISQLLGIPVRKYLQYGLKSSEGEIFFHLSGNGYHNAEDPAIFILWLNQEAIQISVIYTIAGRCFDDDGCGVTWRVRKVLVPKRLMQSLGRDIIMSKIHIMFREYKIGDPMANVNGFSFSFECEPESI
jgi:hypothetical protein